ncbi:unnamed protein product [Vitrella brassicaformis CCMP3155]|uniref:GMP phosphodiesterase delta subunit domain-containing protein n=2 Tax=Vitrella brassicaformis TaxID=1169539 RepID=A0A0G4EUY5_VITBC|nr:unnamed protein product [Vitrella brassicaformis CCMP3155]|eukprot:CEM01846.1 unnamed protein product [Vitrella brassicaformis CCMP3155]
MSGTTHTPAAAEDESDAVPSESSIGHVSVGGVSVGAREPSQIHPDHTQITPAYVCALNGPTQDFLCPVTANVYNIEFVAFKVRDCDTNQEIFSIAKPPAEESGSTSTEADASTEPVRSIRYKFPADFLGKRNIGTTLHFTVGSEAITNFQLMERHYFRNTLLKSFDFTLPFCIPHTVNEWEAMYELPELSEALRNDIIAHPYETKSDSFYFVEDRLIMHNKAEYKYQ